jgi:hypothetical protein
MKFIVREKRREGREEREEGEERGEQGLHARISSCDYEYLALEIGESVRVKSHVQSGSYCQHAKVGQPRYLDLKCWNAEH